MPLPKSSSSDTVGDGERVQVYIRCRPGGSGQGVRCVHPDGPGVVSTHDTGEKKQGRKLCFGFTRAFFPEPAAEGAEGAGSPGAGATTRDVYDVVGRATLSHALAGFHASLLAYGQTGARRAAQLVGPDACPAHERRASSDSAAPRDAQALERRTRCSARRRSPGWCRCWRRSSSRRSPRTPPSRSPPCTPPSWRCTTRGCGAARRAPRCPSRPGQTRAVSPPPRRTLAVPA